MIQRVTQTDINEVGESFSFTHKLNERFQTLDTSPTRTCIFNTLSKLPTEKGIQEKNVQSFAKKHIGNEGFRLKLYPKNPDSLSIAAIEKAYERICSAEQLSLSQEERYLLFMQTLKYYSTPDTENQPVWHSTSSFALRSILSDGMNEAGGKITGEASAQMNDTQEGVSVSYPNFPYAEHHQQMFARMSMRRGEEKDLLSLDSEALTGKTIPRSYVEAYLHYVSPEVLKRKIAYDRSMNISDVTQEMVDAAINHFVEDFEQREYLPKENWISHVDSNDKKLPTLLEEAQHPFPVFLTLETEELQDRMNKRSPFEYIPFEDRISGKVGTEYIREIRVPIAQISKVQQWLLEERISHIRVVPLEVFEIKRVIEDSADRLQNQVTN